MKRCVETAQRIYPTGLGKIRRVLLDAGFVNKGSGKYSKGTKYGCLRATLKGRKNKTRVRMRHELTQGEKLPDYLLTNDVHAEQALTDIENLLSGAYTAEDIAKMAVEKATEFEEKVWLSTKPKFDRKKGFELVMLGVTVVIDEGMKIKGGDYVSDCITFRPREVIGALEKSEGMDEYFAILADGESSQENVRRAMKKVVPYIRKSLNKKKMRESLNRERTRQNKK